MPELPEVQTIVSMLQPMLVGRKFLTVRLLRQDIHHPPDAPLVSLLTGRRVREVARRGKRIILALDLGATLCIRLGMTGRLTIEDAEAAARPHTHLVIELTRLATDNSLRHLELRFSDPRRFGGLSWHERGETLDDGLGPEPLEIRPADLAQLLGRTRRAIKTALLDQRLIAGIGNIYADEALFGAGIHPRTPANRLAAHQAHQLCRAIKATLRRAIRHGGSTIRDYADVNGQSGRFQDLHEVYGRAEQPCRRCGTSVQRIILGGRSTHFCPKCQRAR
jgi:formamidopyrimidine-DNA glycosylase